MESLHSHQLSVRCHSPQPMGFFSAVNDVVCLLVVRQAANLPVPIMFYLSVTGSIHLPCRHCRLAHISHSKHHDFCESGWPFTHAFMQFYFAQLQLQKTQYLQLGQNRGQYYGGSLPNVNQIGNGNIDLPFQVSPEPGESMVCSRPVYLSQLLVTLWESQKEQTVYLERIFHFLCRRPAGRVNAMKVVKCLRNVKDLLLRAALSGHCYLHSWSGKVLPCTAIQFRKPNTVSLLVMAFHLKIHLPTWASHRGPMAWLILN